MSTGRACFEWYDDGSVIVSFLMSVMYLEAGFDYLGGLSYV